MIKASVLEVLVTRNFAKGSLHVYFFSTVVDSVVLGKFVFLLNQSGNLVKKGVKIDGGADDLLLYWLGQIIICNWLHYSQRWKHLLLQSLEVLGAGILNREEFAFLENCMLT